MASTDFMLLVIEVILKFNTTDQLEASDLKTIKKK